MKKMMIAILLLAGAATASGYALATTGDDDDNGHRGFSDRDLRGTYGFSFDGALHGATREDVASVGLVTFDGRGNGHGERTLVVDGVVLEQEFSGTYSVQRDGSVRSEFAIRTIDPPGIPESVERFAGVCVSRCREGYFTATSSGQGLPVIRGHLRRQ